MALGRGRSRASSLRTFLDKRTLLIAAWALAAVPALIHKPRQFFTGVKGRETPLHEQVINHFQPKPEPSMFAGVFGAPEPTQSSVPAPLVGMLVLGTLIGVMATTGAYKNLSTDEFKFEAPSLSLPSFSLQSANEVSPSLVANDAMPSVLAETVKVPVLESPAEAIVDEKMSFFANLETQGKAMAAQFTSGASKEESVAVAAKNLAPESAKESAKEPVKESAKESAKESSNDAWHLGMFGL